jgi:hypothetical protein
MTKLAGRTFTTRELDLELPTGRLVLVTLSSRWVNTGSLKEPDPACEEVIFDSVEDPESDKPVELTGDERRFILDYYYDSDCFDSDRDDAADDLFCSYGYEGD